jgi:hypothetical protein
VCIREGGGLSNIFLASFSAVAAVGRGGSIGRGISNSGGEVGRRGSSGAS